MSESDHRLTRRVLRDDDLQAVFDEQGYVVVPLISDEEVRSLRDGYLRVAESAEGVNPDGAYNDTYAEFSVIHSRPDFRREAFALIESVLSPAAARHLQDYRPLVANFVNKPPGTGVVPAHQNWSVVDESRYQSVSVWVALVDCTVANGTMLMCDGSHRRLRGRRGMWAYHQFSGIESDLLERHLTPVSIPAGHAIILDDAVVHYSPPNLTPDARLAIQFVMVPAETDALFHQQVDADGDLLDVKVWKVDEAFFFDFWHGDGDERHATLVDQIRVPAPLLDADQFSQLLTPSPAMVAGDVEPPAASRARRGWWRRLTGAS
ncbi:MAG: phytanoyl-CoA dioxygenase family protein [Propionicimonas sp.]